jgi:hypothetical protein
MVCRLTEVPLDSGLKLLAYSYDFSVPHAFSPAESGSKKLLVASAAASDSPSSDDAKLDSTPLASSFRCVSSCLRIKLEYTPSGLAIRVSWLPFSTTLPLLMTIIESALRTVESLKVVWNELRNATIIVNSETPIDVPMSNYNDCHFRLSP